MSLTWTVEQIAVKARALSGKQSTEQISANDLYDKINDYYRNVFPAEVKPEKLKGWYTQATAVSDSGEYTVSADVVLLMTPATVNGSDVDFYQDVDTFKKLYPKDTGAPYAISDPGLAIGSSSKVAVANNAFSFRISGNSYSKPAAETALSGDTIPQNKYGAYRLEIDTDGTISIVEASNNGAGYNTAALAVAALTNESASNACMGFVTVTSTAAGGFVPGTTLLDASGVTATYTDHFHSTRDTPRNLLYDGHILTAGPKPDDIYQIKCRQIVKPTALAASGDPVPIPEWGPVAAYGTAIEILLSEGDTEGAAEKDIGYQYYKNLIARKRLIQKSRNQRARPRF